MKKIQNLLMNTPVIFLAGTRIAIFWDLALFVFYLTDQIGRWHYIDVKITFYVLLILAAFNYLVFWIFYVERILSGDCTISPTDRLTSAEARSVFYSSK